MTPDEAAAVAQLIYDHDQQRMRLSMRDHWRQFGRFANEAIYSLDLANTLLLVDREDLLGVLEAAGATPDGD